MAIYPGDVNQRISIFVRRGGAACAEVLLVVLSGAVPYVIGDWVNRRTPEKVPLHPVLVQIQRLSARLLGLPKPETEPLAAAQANWLWLGMIALPVAVSGWHLLLLIKTGQTTPKRWFGLVVVTQGYYRISWLRSLLRETVAKGVLPIAVAYMLWYVSGTYPQLPTFLGAAITLAIGMSATAIWNSENRSLVDYLVGTRVVDEQTLTDWEEYSEWQVTYATGNVVVESAVPTALPSSRSIRPVGLWVLIQRYPGAALLVMILGGLVLVLSVFITTIAHMQRQLQEEQRSELFFRLAEQVNSSKLDDRLAAVNTLGQLPDQRVSPLLGEIFLVETTDSILEAINQAWLSQGSAALPTLHRLNLRLGGQPNKLKQVNQMIVKLLKFGSSGPLNLQRAYLIDLDLADTNLAGVNLQQANLSRSSLQGVRLAAPGHDRVLGTYDDLHSDLSQANLHQVNLTGAIARQTNFRNSDLSWAALNRIDFSQADLTQANLSSSQAINSRFSQANLFQASFTGANVSDSEFNAADLRQANFSQARAVGSNFSQTDLYQSYWLEADAFQANFQAANLRRADLRSAKLVGADLRNAQLSQANLSDADLSFADLRGATLDGADFQRVALFPAPTTSTDQFIRLNQPPSRAALVKGVDFSRVRNLNQSQLVYICSQGGIHPRCRS